MNLLRCYYYEFEHTIEFRESVDVEGLYLILFEIECKTSRNISQILRETDLLEGYESALGLFYLFFYLMWRNRSLSICENVLAIIE